SAAAAHSVQGLCRVAAECRSTSGFAAAGKLLAADVQRRYSAVEYAYRLPQAAGKELCGRAGAIYRRERDFDRLAAIGQQHGKHAVYGCACSLSCVAGEIFRSS